MKRRWDTDTRGRGVASAGTFVPAVMDLMLAAGEPDWVAEDPDTHLLPHLRRACEHERSPFHFLDAAFADGVYTVELVWLPAPVTPREIAGAVFGLIGSIAESSTNIVERVDGWVVVYDIVTGMVAGQTQWAPHGHVVHLRVGGDPIRTMLERKG